jgi:hypothetical protein
MMNSRFTQTVALSAEALSQEVSGETVILDLPSESYFGLNEIGTRIWQLMQEHGELQQVFDVMLDEFDVEPAQLEQDIRNFCSELVKSGLVTIDDQNAN